MTEKPKDEKLDVLVSDISTDEKTLEKEAENFLNSMEEDDSTALLSSEEPQDLPAYDSPAWHDYIMTLFEDNELLDGHPTCDGCRRVLERAVGPIISTQIKSFVSPTRDNGGTATVCVRIDINVDNENHPLNGKFVSCEEIADVNRSNCDDPYYKYPTATASSRAESRALRKLLRLKTITADEKSEIAEDQEIETPWEIDDTRITDTQINGIDIICRRENINVKEFINSGKNNYKNIYEIKSSTARNMLAQLNRINKGSTKNNFGPYENDWRENES